MRITRKRHGELKVGDRFSIRGEKYVVLEEPRAYRDTTRTMIDTIPPSVRAGTTYLQGSGFDLIDVELPESPFGVKR